MEIVDKIISDPTLRIIGIGIIGLVVVVFVILFVQFTNERKRGGYAKFLWFEANISKKDGQSNHVIANRPSENISGRNINTGTNTGNIGDTINN